MGITLDISGARKRTIQFVGSAEDKLVIACKYAGEKFVKDARQFAKEQGGFGDVTGNLRSSIGYFIVKNGQVVSSLVYSDKNGTDRKTGSNVGKQFIESWPKQSGIQLVGFAGMSYASHVESRGLNVIEIQKEVALINLKDLIKNVTQ